MRKAWSANTGIIRAADAHQVQKWLPSAGFAPEGHVVKVEEARPSPAIVTPQQGVPLSSSSNTVPTPSPVKVSERTSELPLTADEEAIISISALRLLPDELEHIREQAFREGEAEGREKGKQEGIEEGKRLVEATFDERVQKAVAENIKGSHAPILDLLHTIQDDIPKLDTVLAQHILDLALVLAQQMTCNAIHFNKRIIFDVFEEAIRALPREARGWLQIYVHPEDAKLMRDALVGHPNEDEQRIIDDPEILRGGCRLVSRMGELDASLEGRWQTLLKNLAREDKWFMVDVEEEGKDIKTDDVSK